MPGYRGHEERDVTVVLRVPETMKARWSTYARGEGISALVRTSVEAFIKQYPPGQDGRSKMRLDGA